MELDVQRISFFIENKGVWKDEVFNLFIKYLPNRSKPRKIDHTHSNTASNDASVYLHHERIEKPKSSRIQMLLSKVSFRCKPGTVNVLFGSGYENQRRLVEILALRQTSGYLSGKVLYDSVPRRNGWFKDIVHIRFNQNSQLSERYYNRLSVFEYLYYGARLRVSHSVGECRERTRTTIRLVGLDGSVTVNTLSASELRMLSIAVELIGNPTLLCLENPIDGLDASGSIEVMSLLRKIAKRTSMPTTIVYVIKFLDYDMLRYIDNVILFTEHKMVRFQDISKGSMELTSLEKIKCLVVEASAQLKSYSDAAAAVTKRVGILGRFASASKGHINGVLRRIAVDIEQITKNATPGSVDESMTPPRLTSLSSRTPWNEYARTDSENRPSLDGPDQFSTSARRLGKSGQTVRSHKPLHVEISILVARGWKHYFKNALLVRMYFGRLLVAGVLIGFFVWHNGRKIDQDDDEIFYSSEGTVTYQAYNITSTMFILASISIVGTIFAIMILHTNIQIMKYEISSGLHHTFSCWLSLMCVDLPVYLAVAVILATIVWAFMGLHSSPFHAYIGTMILITIAGYSLALAVVVWSQSSTGAMLYFSIYGSFSIVFTGYLQAIPDLTHIYQWATTSAFSRWAFEALMLQAFQKSPNSSTYLDTFGFDGKHSTITFCIEWLIVWCIALQFVVFLGLTPPIYDTNFFKNRFGNRVNRRLIQEALEIDDDDIVIVDEIDTNTDRNRHAGSVILTSPLTKSMLLSGIGNPNLNSKDHPITSPLTQSAELELFKEIKPIPIESQIILSFDNLRYVDKSNRNSLNRDDDSIPSTPGGSFSSPLPQDFGKSHNDVRSLGVKSIFPYQKSEPIFQGLSATIFPTQSCCILDSSNIGTGKVLLQILSSYVNVINKKRIGMLLPGQLYGSIHVTNNEGKEAKYVNSVYVPCGDIVDYFHHPNYNELPSALTVKEVLTYAALLRRTDQTTCQYISEGLCSKNRNNYDHGNDNVSSNMITQSYHATAYHSMEEAKETNEIIGQSSDIHERVQEILSMMGLTLVANTIIGPTSSHSTGILPAQLRCLSIATELINRPNLIFLEDPFHGLDWFDCQVVSIALQNLSKSGRTIIAALERPRSSAVFGFDQMLLLGSGLLLYNGISIHAANYFESIGYERRSDQNPLEFILDIALDRGKRKRHNEMQSKLSSSNQHMTGSLNYQSTTTVFTLEDLADMCRSTLKTTNLLLFQQYRKDKHIKHYPKSPLRASIEATDHSPIASLVNERDSRNLSMTDMPSFMTGLGSDSLNDEILLKAYSIEDYFPPLGPNMRVLLRRGFYVTFSNKKKIILYWFKFFVAGIIVGSIWWLLPDGDYQQRMGLLATSYCFVCIVMVDLLDGIFERKELFMRESRSGSSSYLAHWLCDSSMAQVLNFIGAWLFVIPTYGMTRLRKGHDHVIYYFILIIASIYCNLGLTYALSTLTPSSTICKIIFNGFLMPLQVFMSGYLILLSSLPWWIKWGAYINPMSYFLAGAFVNEFDGNSSALGTVDYTDLKNQFDFHLNRGQALWAILLIGVFYRLLWLILLIMWDTSWRHEGIYRTRVQEVRKRARKFVTANFRWRNRTERYKKHSMSEDIANVLIQDDAQTDLENYNATGHANHRPQSSSERSSSHSFVKSSPGISLLDHIRQVTSELPDEYVLMKDEITNIAPLMRSDDSLGENSGHVDI